MMVHVAMSIMLSPATNHDLHVSSMDVSRPAEGYDRYSHYSRAE